MNKAPRIEVGWNQIPMPLLTLVFTFLAPHECAPCGRVSRIWKGMLQGITWPHRLKVLGSHQFTLPELIMQGRAAVLHLPKFYKEQDGQTYLDRDLGLTRHGRVQTLLSAILKRLLFVSELSLDNLDRRLDAFLQLPGLQKLTVRRCECFDSSCDGLPPPPRLTSASIRECSMSERSWRWLLTVRTLKYGRGVRGYTHIPASNLSRLEKLHTPLFGLNENDKEALPAKLSLVWDMFREMPERFSDRYANVRDLTLRVIVTDKYADFNSLPRLVHLSLVGGTVELRHLPPTLITLALHGVTVDDRHFSGHCCLGAHEVTLRNTTLDAESFDQTFSNIHVLTIGDANPAKVAKLIKAETHGEKRVLDQVVLMRPFARLTPGLKRQLAKVEHLTLIEPQELSMEERVWLLGTVPQVVVTGIPKNQRSQWSVLGRDVAFD